MNVTASHSAPVRVLVVEDNEANRQIIAQMLKAVRAEITWAETGLEGVRAYEQRRFDVVLMDLQMPVMDGFAATEKIRAFEVRTGIPRAPIVVVSAHGAEQDMKRAVLCGADRHLTRPVDAATLLLNVGEAIATARGCVEMDWPPRA